MAKRRAEAAYAGRYAVCGETDMLEFDHINGDGRQHRLDELISAMIV